MHPETLSPETRRVLEKISRESWLSNFYLAGGTALALQLGHRISVDLDFFSQKDFSLPLLKKDVAFVGEYVLTNEEDGTLDGLIDDVKVTFLRYEYPLLYPLNSFEGVALADIRDIACMKLDAVSSRGSRKDFIDIFFLLERFSLDEMLDLFAKKYSHIQYNKLHLLKSLVYFSDAEDEPMPVMLRDVSWDDVKKRIVEETKKSLG